MSDTPKAGLSRQGEKPKILKEISADVLKVSSDIIIIKEAIKDIQSEIRKLNMIEKKIEKGEIISKSNGGWFFS